MYLFNFKQLEEEYSPNKNEYYTVYKCGNIRKISKHHTRFEYHNYDILLKKYHDFYVGWIWFRTADEFGDGLNGRFINGILLINSQTIFYIQIKEMIKTDYISLLPDYSPPAPNEVLRDFHIRKDITGCDIQFILALDEYLIPQSKLIFVNGKLLSFSKISYPLYKEEIQIYNLSKSEDIDSFTFFRLNLILHRGSFEDTLLSATIYPENGENVPFWEFLSYRYK
jgi:hypothetical protein